MTLPQPKDLAKVIYDPVPVTNNLGKQCVCLSFQIPNSALQQLMQDQFGPLMEIQTLQPFWGQLQPGRKRVLCNAGELIIVPQKMLARIDPPAGTDELYRAEPLKDSLADDLREIDQIFDALNKLFGVPHAPSR